MCAQPGLVLSSERSHLGAMTVKLGATDLGMGGETHPDHIGKGRERTVGGTFWAGMGEERGRRVRFTVPTACGVP